MRNLRHLAAAVALLTAAAAGALGIATVTASPAAACSCVLQGLAGYADGADVVFTGTPFERAGREDLGSEVRYTFRVDAVFDGEVAGTADVSTGSQSSACGMPDLELGARYLVFGSAAGRGEYAISSCGGTRPASASYVDRLADRVGDPRPPAAVVTAPGNGDTEQAGEATAGAPAAGGGMGDRALPMALVAGGAGAVIVGALLVGARRAGPRQGRSAAVR